MSKYKINYILNNPPKNIPNDLIEQFFIILKTGDIEQIKKYVTETKIKYNIIDPNKFANKQSPFHVVLELDDKIANDSKKYRLVKFLEFMGAPLDTPDNNNVRPIHLAAKLQDKKIVNFFIKKKVSLNVSDSSNNTPLHYAIIGKEIVCPKKEMIKSLIPKQNINNMNLNEKLEEITVETINKLKSNNTLLNIINTINKIPDMYEFSHYEDSVKKRVYDIENEIFLNKNVPFNINKLQTNLEQLIKTIKNEIIDDVFHNGIIPLDIQIGNKGWGPKDQNGILPSTKNQLLDDISNESEKKKLSMNLDIVNNLINKLDGLLLNGLEFFDGYLFCDKNLHTIIDNNSCSTKYAFDYTIKKIFFLLNLNYYRVNFSLIVNNIILNLTVKEAKTNIKDKLDSIHYFKNLNVDFSSIYYFIKDKISKIGNTDQKLAEILSDDVLKNLFKKIKTIIDKKKSDLRDPLNDEYLYQLLLPNPISKSLLDNIKILNSNDETKIEIHIWNDKNELDTAYYHKYVDYELPIINYDTDITLDNLHEVFEKNYNSIIIYPELYPDIKDYLNKNIIKNLNNLSLITQYKKTTKMLEFYSLNYCETNIAINLIKQNTILLEIIINRIIRLLNIGNNYFIAQLCLPLLVIMLNKIITQLININNNLDNAVKILYSRGYIDDDNAIMFTITFVNFIKDNINQIYSIILEILSSHNDIINLLNFDSSMNLLKGEKNIFDKNLLHIDEYPQDIADFRKEKKHILKNYKIPKITYYNDFNNTDLDPILDVMKNFDDISYDKYNNGVKMKELQIKIEGKTVVKPDKSPFAGTWIEDDKFSVAYIGYNTKNYKQDIKSKLGVFPSIKTLGSMYLIFQKYSIIEEILPKDLDDIIKDKLNDFNNDQKNVIVAKIIDSSLNNIIDYAILSSVSQWVKKIYDNSLLSKELNVIFRDKDFLNIYLNGMEEKIVKDFLSSPLLNIRSKLSTVEHNINNISNTSIHPYKFIHYLYDTNYYTDTNSNYTNCYKVNPRIFEKLITSKNLYMKNADGYTPLHLAILYHNSKIVNILIKKYQNLKSFTDNYKRTPNDLILNEFKIHINFLKGDKIKDIYHNVTLEFNDMLINKLNLLKFNNNMMINITYGIPILIVIYNHMFNLYLRNYRYNFTIETKNEFDKLSQKYLHKVPNIYPVDIFELPKEEIENIVKKTSIRQYAKKDIAEKNKSKIDLLNKQLEIYTNQIKELNIEKMQKNSTEDIAKIDGLIKLATSNQISIQKEIDDLTLNVKNKKITKAIKTYSIGLDKIKNNERILSLTEFYNLSFNDVSKNNILHFYLWRHYLNTNIENTPSMIFILVNISLNNIIENIKSGGFNLELQLELSSVRKFLNIYKKYIDLKEALPENLTDNYILKSEFDHIIYLINLLITDNALAIIINNIYEGLLAMETYRVPTNKNSFIKELLSVKYDNYNLDNYLRNILPLKMLKYFTTIYNSDSDIDRKIISATEFFIPVINIIKNNGYVTILDDSVIIQNFKDYIIPFLINTYQSFIYTMRLIPYTYEKYLLNSYQLVEILSDLNL